MEVKVIRRDPTKGLTALVDDPRRSYMCTFDGDEPVDTLIFDKFNLGRHFKENLIAHFKGSWECSL